LRKILLIARRDYVQTVTSKGYLVALVLMPLMFGGSILAVSLANRGNSSSQRIAVIDHTGILGPTVIQAAEQPNGRAANPAPGFQTLPKYTFEELKPDADEAGQLLSVSNRIRSGDLYLVLDIPAGALRPAGDSDRDQIVYYTNGAGSAQLGPWLTGVVNYSLRRVRLLQAGVDSARLPELLREVPVVSANLASRDPVTGKIGRGTVRNPLQAIVVPTFLVVLMVLVVMIGAAPHIGAVAEDKMQRVFEMLLSSASSFELMMGKVLAALGACLTTSTLYIAGGLMALLGMATFGLAPLHLLPWFFVYLIADVLMLSAMGVALGSACGSAQDAQQLAFLLFVPILIPMMTLGRITQQPNGTFATAMSFIPPFTPVLMLMRQALPGGVPWWQPWVGLVGVVVCVFGAIWAASRIFRIGILATGKTPKLAELAEWVLRG
jgi:ABC-2 type transport system permease protein